MYYVCLCICVCIYIIHICTCVPVILLDDLHITNYIYKQYMVYVCMCAYICVCIFYMYTAMYIDSCICLLSKWHVGTVVRLYSS